MNLKEKLYKKILLKREELKELMLNDSQKVIGEVRVKNIVRGMRDLPALLSENSSLDPFTGIHYRDYPIDKLLEILPKNNNEQAYCEGVFYLLLTGELPKNEDIEYLKSEFIKRSKNIPQYVFKLIDTLPKETHAITQYISAITALQNESIFAKKYQEGIKKQDYWIYMYEDALNIISYAPYIASYIYRRKYNKEYKQELDLDWGANFLSLMGYNDRGFRNLIRLYLNIHAENESAALSTHTSHLVGSALSDIYLSYSAGISGLAGPLHGLANQEVLRWLLKLQEELKDNITEKNIEEFLLKTLKSGSVIPGYGHAVLKVTDPRFTVQRNFALKNFPEDKLVKLVNMIYKVAPKVLSNYNKKIKCPYPNIDAHSGVLLTHYGFKEFDFYTVMFAMARLLGISATLIWDRALLLPLERPEALSIKSIKEKIKNY